MILYYNISIIKSMSNINPNFDVSKTLILVHTLQYRHYQLTMLTERDDDSRVSSAAYSTPTKPASAYQSALDIIGVTN